MARIRAAADRVSARYPAPEACIEVEQDSAYPGLGTPADSPVAVYARALARSRGCTEFASDRLLDNEASGAFHLAAGFEETERVVCYRKDL